MSGECPSQQITALPWRVLASAVLRQFSRLRLEPNYIIDREVAIVLNGMFSFSWIPGIHIIVSRPLFKWGIQVPQSYSLDL